MTRKKSVNLANTSENNQKMWLTSLFPLHRLSDGKVIKVLTLIQVLRNITSLFSCFLLISRHFFRCAIDQIPLICLHDISQLGSTWQLTVRLGYQEGKSASCRVMKCKGNWPDALTDLWSACAPFIRSSQLIVALLARWMLFLGGPLKQSRFHVRKWLKEPQRSSRHGRLHRTLIESPLKLWLKSSSHLRVLSLNYMQRFT